MKSTTTNLIPTDSMMVRKIRMTGEHARYVERREKDAAADDREIVMEGCHACYEETVGDAVVPQDTPVIDADRLRSAVEECRQYFWGHSSLATIFCVCRDMYNMSVSVSDFERLLAGMNIECPQGTIANALRNNPYMRYPVRRWVEKGAKERVLRLADEFQQAVDKTDMEPT